MSNIPKFTPGPWQWIDVTSSPTLISVPDDEVIVACDLPDFIDPCNMPLLAAAPDYYAAAEQMKCAQLKVTRSTLGPLICVPESA